MSVPVLVPAYNPTQILLELVKALVQSGFQNIVVVNDGSKPEHASVFEEIRKFPECTVLQHSVNFGKGAALKTGLRHIYCSFSGQAGVVTLDADGQHLVDDVLKVEVSLLSHPENLVMGVRKFDKDVPFRSKVGNFLTRILFRVMIGQKLTDTQTGLRGIPMGFIPQLLKIPSSSYEFELDMLLACKCTGRRIFEQAIQTVYLDGNKSSHFNILIDSLKIYLVLLRFALTGKNMYRGVIEMVKQGTSGDFSLESEILIINPYITSAERYGKDIGDIGGHQMPLGIYYLAAYLLREGKKVDVIDAESLLMHHDQVIDLLKRSSAKIIGITSTTVAFRNARSLAEMIRKELPDVVLVIGGPHMTAIPEATMRCGAFDYGIVREGEIAFLKLVKFLLDKEGCVEDVPNLYYFENAQLRNNSAVEFITDMDSIPFPARELCRDISLYKPPVGAFRYLPTVSMITSRGCPYECIFCDNNTFGRKTRFYSAEYVVAEIKELVQKYNAKEVAFLDDTFILDKKRLYRIFELLDQEDIHLSWTCMTRVNNLDRELLKFMRDHGCWQIKVGIESGNQKILDFIKKGITLEQARNVASWCKELKIFITGFFMIGHHIDTPETVQEMIEFAMSLPLTDATATLNTPMPGTESYRIARQYGVYNESDWTSLNYWIPIFIPNGLTREFMLTKQSEFYRRFYSRPSVLLSQLARIRSFENLTSLFRHALLGLKFVRK